MQQNVIFWEDGKLKKLTESKERTVGPGISVMKTLYLMFIFVLFSCVTLPTLSLILFSIYLPILFFKMYNIFPLFFSFSSSQTTPPCCSLTQTHTGTTHRLPYNFSNVYNAIMAVYFCYVVFFCQYCSSILPQRNGQLFGAGVWRGAQSPHRSLSLWFWLPSRSLSIHRWRICRSLFILSKRLQRGICLCAPSGYTLSKPSNDSS